MVVVDLNRSVLEQQPRNIQLIVFHSFMEGGSSLVVCDVRQPLIAFKKVPNNFCMPSACGRVQTSYACGGSEPQETLRHLLHHETHHGKMPPLASGVQYTFALLVVTQAGHEPRRMEKRQRDSFVAPIHCSVEWRFQPSSSMYRCETMRSQKATYHIWMSRISSKFQCTSRPGQPVFVTAGREFINCSEGKGVQQNLDNSSVPELTCPMQSCCAICTHFIHSMEPV
mmetsp:Transcript_12539/g.28293  ORF Transcript_12539/g.28293 Transcript_12539/m.28293 type:complete len:226 (+) Transcript_12539:909-1586(+)